MTFHFTDPDGDKLIIEPTQRHGQPAVSMRNERADNGDSAAVHIPADQIEDVIAGMRDARREASGQPNNGTVKIQFAADSTAVQDAIRRARRTGGHP